MLAFLNGRFVPEESASVPISDRGLLYGDGLFETIRVRGGQPLLWKEHVDRLRRGCQFLQISLSLSADELLAAALRLIAENALPESVLRITVTRGSGARGYSPKAAGSSTLALTVHPLPPVLTAARLRTASFRVPANDPLAHFKTANRLVSVLARAEAEEHGADEALLLNTDGFVAEASGSNVFWIEQDVICTAPVSAGALAGIIRSLVLERCSQKWPVAERLIKPAALHDAAAVFLTNSVSGIVPVSSLDGQLVAQSPLIAQICEVFRMPLQGKRNC